MSGIIFINYRRDDASYPAGHLYERLSARFTQNKIFMDIDTLMPGLDFVDAIQKSVGSCDVLIAVIGKHWLTVSVEEGRRRLDNPEDFVRLEIATALRRRIPVIPVLVERAVMPRAEQLPEDLKPLVRRQAIEVSHDRFRADSEWLIGAVEQALEASRTDEQRNREGQERVEAERREREEKERLETERSQKGAQDRLQAEKEGERLQAEPRQRQGRERLVTKHRERKAKAQMLRYRSIFVAVTIIAAFCGLSGIAGNYAWVAYILSLVFLVLSILSFSIGRRSSL
jgi:uncharacterized membrane protein YtjA (UPF0391 family)